MLTISLQITQRIFNFQITSDNYEHSFIQINETYCTQTNYISQVLQILGTNLLKIPSKTDELFFMN